MDKKELDSMMKHRGLFLALGLAALIALPAPVACAGNLTMTISFGSNTLTFDYTNSTYAATGSNADTLIVNVGAVNSQFLGAPGATGGPSEYAFGDLGANSNNPGAANGTLSETGTALLNGGGTNTSPITVYVTQNGYTSPLGAGFLGYTATSNFTNAATPSTETTSSSFNATTTTPITDTFVSGGSNPQSYSHTNSLGGLTATGSYSLDDSATISLTGTSSTKDQFSVSAAFSTVPEPASLVLMLTGMPLPLVVMGLLRRRRAAA
jgi:hypothetical protein